MSLPCSAAFILSAVCLSACASEDASPGQERDSKSAEPSIGASVDREPDKRNTHDVKLTVVAREDGGVVVVTLNLTNEGREPIRVDKDLVFLVDVRVENKESRVIDAEYKDEVKRSSDADIRGRFVRLSPGESVSRTIGLRDKFTEFRWGIGTFPGGIHQIDAGYEAMVQFPQGETFRRVIVDYAAARGFEEAFHGYVGVSADDAGLFLGPLRAECMVPSSNSTGQKTGEGRKAE
jgi:hypothetical protein